MSKRAGFSLVEVLVALAVFALIAGAGASVLVVSLNTRDGVRQASEGVAELQRLRAMLRADIGQAADRRTRGANGRPSAQPMMTGQGQSEALLVLTRAGWTNPGEDPRPSLQRVEYRLVEDRLERRFTDHLDGARPGPPQVLARGVRAAEVSFMIDGQAAPAYAASMERPLPDAVRVRLTLDGLGAIEQLFLTGAEA